MEFFRIRRTIPFMRHALVFNVISLVVFLLSVFFLATKGLHFSIEFLGGTVIEVSYPQVADADKVRETLDGIGVKDVSVQTFGSSRDILVRLPLKAAHGESQNVAMQKQTELVFSALTQSAGGEAPECAALHQSYRDLIATDIKARDPAKIEQYESATRGLAGKCVELKRVEFVGGQVGKELATDGGLALLFVCIGIVIYLAFRFEWRFAVATIIANLHDVVIILGFFAFFQWEFSLPVLAAILAVFGYSVNESVVVFDRVRENFRKMRKASVPEVMDASITGTISRTIITHGCTQMMVLSIFFFGGPSLHYFALALTIGICFGIYSSVLVACPLAMYLGASREDFVKPEKKTVDPVVP
ncbi:MAG: protein translocase subunit SecF [Usitatibacter sp.]